MRVHHLAIQVHDLELVRDFYVRVLGLRELRRPREGAVWLDCGGTVLMLEQVDGEPVEDAFRTPRTGLHLLALAITDREAWERRLQSHGVALVEHTRHTLYVRDPEGNRVGLSTLDVEPLLAR
jgi:catechol 2,3-dioxygenase-like lactoylglutathione lyase family enzyme